MSTRVSRFASPALLLLLTAACAGGDGQATFEGEWEATDEDGSRSVLTLWKEQEGYRLIWNRWLADGTHTVRCGRDGRCVGFHGPLPVVEYRFRIEPDAEGPGLLVECNGVPLHPRTEPYRYVDRLTLESGGRELRSFQIELNGEPVDPPRGPRIFTRPVSGRSDGEEEAS